jgi:hypothetical protein
MQEILTPTVKKACSFEAFENAKYQERNLGRLILAVLSAIEQDTDNCFSYIQIRLKLLFTV